MSDGMVGRWVLACRPRTLTAAVAPVLVGTGLACRDGHAVKWHLAGLALLSATAIQIATNLFNDALDYRRGADRGARLGPVRATQGGLIAASDVMRGAVVAWAIAALFGLPLVVAGGWPILGIGLASLGCAYAYTGGPFPLAYRGLGEVFVVLFFGLAAVGGMYYLHGRTYGPGAAVAGLQVGLLATALLAVNNLRDVAGDRASGKRTLAVRFGVAFGRVEIALLVSVPFAMNLGWALDGAWPAGALTLLALPLAVGVIRTVYRHPPGPIYNACLGRTAALHLAFGVLLAVGLAL